MHQSKAHSWTRALSTLGLLLLPLCSAQAQDTEGMQTQQIIPIVVDSATFKSRIDLLNPFGYDITFDVTYVPGTGTSQASSGALACNAVVVPAAKPLTIASMRDICPGLAAGNQFGFLKLVRAGTHGSLQMQHQMGVHGYSRVSNYQGQGFSVEAFPMHTINWGRQVVSGIRRLAATANSPAYQSNCFVGTLDDSSSGTISISLADAENQPLGQTIAMPMGPNQLTRVLDVFAAAGLASGDYDNVKVTFTGDGSAPTFYGFCTVQDNTSFGADFRIAKQVNPRDLTHQRIIVATSDMLGRKLSLPASSFDHYQLLALEFRHPDQVNCITYGVSTPPNPPPDLPSNVEFSLWIKDPQQRILRKVMDNGQFFYASELASTKTAINDGIETTLYALIARTGGGPVTDYTLQCLSGSGMSKPVIVDDAPFPFFPPTY